MTNEDFKKLVAEMREAQKKYFNNRGNFALLNEAMKLEQQVDEQLNPNLFTNK